MKITVNAKDQTHTFDCDSDEKILHAGLRSGIALPYECGSGTCGTCKASLRDGDVRNEWTGAPGQKGLKPERAEVLMCQCVPLTDCALDVGSVVRPIPATACVPGVLDAIIRRRVMLTHDVVSLDVELARPMDFEAGQFVLMTVPGVTGARAYSMVNFDRQASRLAFVVKKKPDGRLSDWLFDGSVDDTRIGLFGPLGAATFDPAIAKHVVCIAGGSGIAGMMSILSRAAQERYFDHHAGHVFFGIRTRRDIFFLDELSAFQSAGGSLNVTIAFSDEDVDPGIAARYPRFGFGKGFVHAVAAEGMKGGFDNVRAYAAGPPPMVDATLRMLLIQGKLKPADIRYDKFS